jgi:hypothetical protein
METSADKSPAHSPLLRARSPSGRANLRDQEFDRIAGIE